MPAEYTIGDNYSLEESSTGDLEVIDTTTGDVVLTHDNSVDQVDVNKPIAVTELIDGGDVSHTAELADAADLVHDNLSGLSDDDHTQYLLVGGSRAMNGALDVGDNDLDNVGAVSEQENVVSAPGSSYTADLNDGGVHKITIDQDCDITISNEDSSKANSLTLVVAQDSTGGYSLTFSTTIKWAGGSKPSIASGANEITRLSFTYIDGAWLGAKAGEAFA